MKDDASGSARLHVIHFGPASPGGMHTMIHLLMEHVKVTESSRFVPTYLHFKSRYIVNGLRFLRCWVDLLLRPDRKAIYQLHTAEKGSFWRKFLLSRVLLMHGIPYVVHMHGARFNIFLDATSPLTKRLVNKFASQAASFVVLSESWARYFRGHFPDLTNIEVIPNPCETVGEIYPGGRKNERVRILYSGVFGARKGVFDLIEAFADVPENPAGPDLYLFGDGDVEAVRTAAKASGAGARIHVSGWLDHKSYLSQLRDYDFYVLPSYAEGLPMSILEAMGQGLPIISTRVGGIPEVVFPGQNGYLIDPGDKVALREALDKLAQDGATRSNMSRKSWEIARERFSLNILIPRWDMLYKRISSSQD